MVKLSDESPEQGGSGSGPRAPADADDLFRLVAETTRDMVIVGRPSGNEWVSPAVEEVLGYTADEFLGMDTLSLVHTDDLQRIHAARRRIAGGEAMGGRLRLRHRDGTWRWLETRVRPLPDPDGTFSGRSISSWRDVSPEVQARQRLVASEERYRLLVEHISDGVVLERDGVIVWASPNLHGMLGWDPDEWVGRALAELVGPAARADLEAAAGAPARREPVRSRIHVPGADGAGHWLELAVRPFVGADGVADGNAWSVRVIDSVVAAEAELEHRARHDQLTGLLNRKEVLDRLDALGTDSRHAGRETAVLFCDLDDFKVVNDTFGHSVGDEVLREVAARVRSAVRDTDLVARIGGDELLVVLQHLHGVDEALTVADQIRRAVAPAIGVPGGVVSIGVSVGVALIVAGDSADAVIARADAAMYQVKATARAVEPELPFEG